MSKCGAKFPHRLALGMDEKPVSLMHPLNLQKLIFSNENMQTYVEPERVKNGYTFSKIHTVQNYLLEVTSCLLLCLPNAIAIFRSNIFSKTISVHRISHRCLDFIACYCAS